MARRANYESLAVAAPVVAARETDMKLSASSLSRRVVQQSPKQPPSCSPANSLKGDQVLIGESNNRKVVMQ